jgi:peptide/nickel transport system permease protein
MSRFIAQRLLITIPTLVGVSIVSFLLLKLVPGDPAAAILGTAAADQSALEEVRKALGLTQPWPVQYWIWFTNVLHGNFGTSTEYRVPVSSILFEKVGNTLILTAGSLAFAIGLGLLFGILSAVWRGSLFDRVAMLFSLVGASAPVFWTGILLSYFFSLRLGWFPALGMHSAARSSGVGDLLYHLVLPAFANSTIALAVIARVVRSTMLDMLHQPYILAARSRGFSTRRVIRYAFRAVLPDTINITGLQVGFLFGGALFTEVVFNWPGIGSLIYNSIVARDYVTVQAAVLVVSTVFVLVNLVSDVSRVALDPRRQE